MKAAAAWRTLHRLGLLTLRLECEFITMVRRQVATARILVSPLQEQAA